MIRWFMGTIRLDNRRSIFGPDRHVSSLTVRDLESGLLPTSKDPAQGSLLFAADRGCDPAVVCFLALRSGTGW
jgi:hypothetical protein